MSDRVTQDEFRAYMTSAGVGYRLAMRHFADRAPPLGTARRWGTTKPKGRASKGDAPYQSGHTPRKKPPPTPPTAGPVFSVPDPPKPRKRASAAKPPPGPTDNGDLVGMSSVQFHEWLIRETQRRMDGCSVAETTALRQLKSAYEGLQEAKSQEAPELDAADMPRGEYLGIVRDRATTADLDELEVWVDVWLAKMGLEMSVGGDGAPLLARA